MEKTIYKTKITVTVLSEDKLGDVSLESLGRDCIEGDLSCDIKIGDPRPLSGEEAIKAIRSQNSDPSFFGFEEQPGE
jgi:hypothetical protein